MPRRNAGYGSSAYYGDQFYAPPEPMSSPGMATMAPPAPTRNPAIINPAADTFTARKKEESGAQDRQINRSWMDHQADPAKMDQLRKNAAGKRIAELQGAIAGAANTSPGMYKPGELDAMKGELSRLQGGDHSSLTPQYLQSYHNTYQRLGMGPGKGVTQAREALTQGRQVSDVESTDTRNAMMEKYGPPELAGALAKERMNERTAESRENVADTNAKGRLGVAQIGADGKMSVAQIQVGGKIYEVDMRHADNLVKTGVMKEIAEGRNDAARDIAAGRNDTSRANNADSNQTRRDVAAGNAASSYERGVDTTNTRNFQPRQYGPPTPDRYGTPIPQNLQPSQQGPAAPTAQQQAANVPSPSNADSPAAQDAAAPIPTPSAAIAAAVNPQNSPFPSMPMAPEPPSQPGWFNSLVSTYGTPMSPVPGGGMAANLAAGAVSGATQQVGMKAGARYRDDKGNIYEKVGDTLYQIINGRRIPVKTS
jgi:hypothetical protein